MEFIGIIKFFCRNIFFAICGVAVGYTGLIVAFFRFECWKEEIWTGLYNNLCIPLNKNKVFVAGDTYNESARIFPVNDKPSLDYFRKANWTSIIYTAGVKHINLVCPQKRIILRLLAVAIFIGMLVSLPITWDNTYNSLNFKASTIVAVITASLTCFQYILLNFLRNSQNRLNDYEISLESLLYMIKSFPCKPKQRKLISKNHYYMSFLESNLANNKTNSTDTIYLFFSVKNKRFERDLLKYIISHHFCDFNKRCIVMVDKPYLENLKADFSGTLLQEKIDNLSTIRSEKILCLNNAVEDMKKTNIDIPEYDLIHWSQIEREVSPQLRNEILHAIDMKNGLFRRDVLAEVSHVLNKTPEEAVNYIGFFKVELPVLFHVYYELDGSVDIYPGNNTPIVWNLENGKYLEELPMLSHLANKSPLRYIEVEKVS